MPPMSPRVMLANVRRLAAMDVLYGGVVLAFTAAAAGVWWLSVIVPAMDYPQFLVFARAVEDYGNPASPFHGTYTTASWLMPAALPVYVTIALSRLAGGSLETAGKLLLSFASIGMVAAGVFLLRTLGRPRWAIVLIFPLILSRWTLVGGYIVFATSLPFVVLAWALAVRWLRRLDVPSGTALAACLCVTFFWHGIGYVLAGLGFGSLWCAWRAPSMRARLLSVWPTALSLLLFAAWMSSTFGQHNAARSTPPAWRSLGEAAGSIVEYVWVSVPNAQSWALALVALIAAGWVWDRTGVGRGSGVGASTVAREGIWRARPLSVIAGACLVAYLFIQSRFDQVEGVSIRFAYPAALALLLGWDLPRGRTPRALVIASVGLLSGLSLGDVAARMRSFDEDTRGASALIDRIGAGDTLYFNAPERGVSKDFAPAHPCLRELQQVATIRHGGLPNSSFAGYGCNYVRYVGGRNPMPGLSGPARWGSAMTRFDYVLARQGQGPADARFRLVASAAGWQLFGVCGSARFPVCS
ncbi:MAG: hypothetical protein ACREJ3_19775 [Polyangiaceae bacterium]